MSCPRCGDQIRPPDLMHSDWRCDNCGDVSPFHAAKHIGGDIVAMVLRQPAPTVEHMPLWCPWPLPPGWTVTGVGWAGDDRTRRTGDCSCLQWPGTARRRPGRPDVHRRAAGRRTRHAVRRASPGIDPGYLISEALADSATHAGSHAKIRVGGHPTPLWCVKSPGDRSAYVSEAKGMWLYTVAWPASAGYFLAEHVELHDLSDGVPPELVYGAPSPHLLGQAG